MPVVNYILLRSILDKALSDGGVARSRPLELSEVLGGQMTVFDCLPV
jgi:hypothetical protein